MTREMFRYIATNNVWRRGRPQALASATQALTKRRVHYGRSTRALATQFQKQSGPHLSPISKVGSSRRRLTTSTDDPPKVLVNDSIENQEILIELDSGDGTRNYPSFWLRDHCLCDVCSHPSTHQRQHDTFALDPLIKVADVNPTPPGLEVTWAGADEHTSFFPWEWLAQHSPHPTARLNAVARHQRTRRWTPWTSESPEPVTSYKSLQHPAGQHSLFSNIHTYGLAFVTGTPPTPEATISILNTLGPIRHTHYGGFWDFTSEVNPIDTAYTNLSLPLHTDNTYFTDPAGLQLFHLLSHMPSSTDQPQPGDFHPSLGGESTFADGFAAAEALYNTDRRSYNILATQPIVFAAEGSPAGNFRNDRTHTIGSPVFSHTNPVLRENLNPFNPSNLTQIRWNNCDRSPLTMFESQWTMREWFRAAQAWNEILMSEEFEVEVKLRPGQPVVFDNWRILHGRREFKGKRRMCGAYIGMDDFRAGCGRVGVYRSDVGLETEIEA